MQVQAETGAELEREWHSKLQYYQSKYPQEAAEFESLLDGGMVPGWEDSLPVMSRHLCWKFWNNFLQWMSSEIKQSGELDSAQNHVAILPIICCT